jgi:hypothetical protein
MKKLDENELVELGVMTHVMAVRECLMQYFKGTTVASLADNVDVWWDSIGYDDEENHNYRRREHEMRSPMRLLMNGSPLLEVQHHPNIATLYPRILGRSDEYSQMSEHITKFFNRYLGSVELKENKTYGSTGHRDGSSDKSQMLSTARRYAPSKDRQADPVEAPQTRPITSRDRLHQQQLDHLMRTYRMQGTEMSPALVRQYQQAWNIEHLATVYNDSEAVRFQPQRPQRVESIEWNVTTRPDFTIF